MRRSWPVTLAALALVVMGGTAPASAEAAGPTTGPTTGSAAGSAAAKAAVCGSSSLDGPTAPPAGAVVVPEGDNSGVDLRKENTTYYFKTGTHKLGDGEYAQIIPGKGATFIGAPGAVLDGRGLNRYAFGGDATGVTIRYLTIKGFIPRHDEGAVNHDSGDRWIVEHNTIRDNAGAGLMAGAENQIRGNCLKDNGQYGLNAYKAGNTITGLVVADNEFTGNNTQDWEHQIPGCGCTGGMKFWAVNGADVTGNWVHANHGPGVWADTNDNDFLIEDNLIEDNDSLGIFYEISYNAIIRNNTLRGNAWASGAERAAKGDPFPEAAIYLSEADGEPRVPARTSKIEITGNLLENNWGGITAWANADRFCNSPASTTGDCTLIVGPTNTARCAAPAIASEPLYTDCRWWTKNVDVHHNTFAFDPADVHGGCPTQYCGHMALLSNWGTYPDWSPYKGAVIQQAIVHESNNSWHDNTYTGPWQFRVTDMGKRITPGEWAGPQYGQDARSTFDGAAPEPPAIAAQDFESATTSPYTPWYGAAVEHRTGDAHGGTGSLRLTSAEAFGSAVALDNFPGFSGVIAGTSYRASLWHREAVAPMPAVTWNLRWHDEGGTVLRTDPITLARQTAWTQAADTFTAPAGATRVDWTFVWNASAAGPAFQIDDVALRPA
ncbi:right-handed parallel beta-helix repeat-containing protein [Actinomadura sp. ATCC 31491]|uniref:Right-handed parallel beta-helix repeat-containing protein n=1 Tax=Actinomadura luzonensis TaxID=2805427 RepID=A0ABT0FR68_9ACTN|nr:right-handed parallel beta-helix repeat-containing protein [Actinomadura luzonensis]MCK2214545.1 right-handed parallel beta-helix repeat-containing protein [Actinomadura luzonensis]